MGGGLKPGVGGGLSETEFVLETGLICCGICGSRCLRGSRVAWTGFVSGVGRDLRRDADDKLSYFLGVEIKI